MAQEATLTVVRGQLVQDPGPGGLTAQEVCMRIPRGGLDLASDLQAACKSSQ